MADGSPEWAPLRRTEPPVSENYRAAVGGIEKSATFVETRHRALGGLAGAVLLMAASAWAVTVLDDDFGVLALFLLGLALAASHVRRLIRPYRLTLDQDGIVEVGPQTLNRLDKTSWDDIGPVTTIQQHAVSFTSGDRKRPRTLRSYGLRSPVLAALMNDMRAGHRSSDDPEGEPSRAIVSAADVYFAEDQPEMIREVAPLEESLAMPPEASGSFLVLGTTSLSPSELAQSNRGRVISALVNGEKKDVFLHLGDQVLAVVAFIRDGGGALVTAPIGADLAMSFWSAYTVCGGRLRTL